MGIQRLTAIYVGLFALYLLLVLLFAAPATVRGLEGMVGRSAGQRRHAAVRQRADARMDRCETC